MSLLERVTRYHFYRYLLYFFKR